MYNNGIYHPNRSPLQTPLTPAVMRALESASSVEANIFAIYARTHSMEGGDLTGILSLYAARYALLYDALYGTTRGTDHAHIRSLVCKVLHPLVSPEVLRLYSHSFATWCVGPVRSLLQILTTAAKERGNFLGIKLGSDPVFSIPTIREHAKDRFLVERDALLTTLPLTQNERTFVREYTRPITQHMTHAYTLGVRVGLAETALQRQEAERIVDQRNELKRSLRVTLGLPDHEELIYPEESC